MTRWLCAAGLVLALGLAADVKCPVDNGNAYFTGATRTDRQTGKLLHEFKCYINGHRFWIVK